MAPENPNIKLFCPAQTWITPDRRGHAPQYGSAQFAPADRRNRLLHILGGTGAPPAWAAPSGSGIRLHQARLLCYPEPLPYTTALAARAPTWAASCCCGTRLHQAHICHSGWVGC